MNNDGVFLYIRIMIRKILLLSTYIVILSCSDKGEDTPVPEKPEAIIPPIAVNDQVSATEDQETIISGLTVNDENAGNSRINSIDLITTSGGTIVDNRDGTYTYAPEESFTGEDTFTYTLCDSEDTPNCSTATVRIMVEDEGSPLTSDDSAFMIKNDVLIVTGVLDNDELIDDSNYFSVDGTSSIGSVVMDSDGQITYTAALDFTGTDTFVYTICDDDTPTATCANATVTVAVLEPINLNVPSNLDYYYGDLGLTDNGDVNYEQLKNHTTLNHTTILSYGQRHQFLYNADASLTNQDNVTLMYSAESRYWEEYTSGTNAYSPQTFNTEHVYPQSKLIAEEAVTDLHHLRACDAIVNEDRLNFPFIEGSGSFGLNGENWYPGDEWKGDVARMIFYLNVRYGETFEKVGNVELFLEWNAADPVSNFEIQRNMVIEAAQGVRNPFIDNPYIATLIWGGASAENKWQ